jgi:hypothetical protein
VKDFTPHPTPPMRDVVREQIRIVGLSLRRDALVVAAVLAVVSIIIAIDIAQGTAATWFDSDDWFPLGLVAFFVPFAVWRSDRPFGPAFLWTLPVDSRRLAFAKVFAGWVWLMAALALFAGWQLTLALLSGVRGAETVPLFSAVGVTGMYLLGSALVLGLRHPLRWLLGAAGVFFLLGFLNQRFDALAFVSAICGADTAPQALPPLAGSAIAAVIWLGGGLAALSIAIARHRENRRR